MANGKQWSVTLARRIYREHAEWAELVMRRMYPVICTSTQDHEFVLSEHAYSLQEGPNIPGRLLGRVPHSVCNRTPTGATAEKRFATRGYGRSGRCRQNAEGNRIECLFAGLPVPQDAKSILSDRLVCKTQRFTTIDAGNLSTASPGMTVRKGSTTTKLLFPLFRY
jgi:hypothetical protein